jgi:putative ABC transport system permease protein
LIPVVLAASGLWLFWLFSENVRSRSFEIGILRAIGVKTSSITVFFHRV